ncbi:MAG: acyltransferase [Leeuwenhoekiella sp.]
MRNWLKNLVKKSPVLLRVYHYAIRKNDISKRIIKGSNNTIDVHYSASLDRCSFNIKGDNNTIEVHELSHLRNFSFYIRGNNNHIQLSRGVRFNRGGSIWIEDVDCVARIGDHTTFEDTHIALTEPGSKIEIGSDCMFANDIDIRTGDSHSIMDNATRKRINYAQNVVIGDHVWVAPHVSILKGVHIGSNSVVATRTVVARSFPEQNIVIAGMPAKKINENISWDRQRIYDREFAIG